MSQVKEGYVKVGCGCWGCLVEILAFVLICSIFGCEWAQNTVERCTYGVVRFVHKAWDATGSQPAQIQNRKEEPSNED